VKLTGVGAGAPFTSNLREEEKRRRREEEKSERLLA
jgi:hypothetical protein